MKNSTESDFRTKGALGDEATGPLLFTEII